MESLALLSTLIVSPAFLGGPLALASTFWKPDQVSNVRKSFVYLLGSLSMLFGIYLVFGQISSGARNIGILGIVCGLLAIWRIRNHSKP